MQRPPTCDHPLREVFDLNKHWPQSRPLPFFTQVVGQKGYKDLYLLEANPEFYYFVLSELPFTNKCASITRAEKIITLYVLPSDITQMLSQLFFLVTPALFLNCILPALSPLPHFNRQKIVWWALCLWCTFHLPNFLQLHRSNTDSSCSCLIWVNAAS